MAKKHRVTNADIADKLQQIAELLETQGENRYRVRAYRHAADSVRHMGSPAAQLVCPDDRQTLEDIPGVGKHIASLITSYVQTGRMGYLDRLLGDIAPETVLGQVPGIAQTLAHRIAAQLDATTLEELEQAAHDGRLSTVKGFGPKRVQAVKIALAGMLSGAAQRRLRAGGEVAADLPRPRAGTLLEVDRIYQERADKGDLRMIAPKRFNPEGRAWLPVMHLERHGWHFTALYSNTARAHELGKLDDWVVLYYEGDGDEGQATVVTETQGPLRRRRVVRGRESECQQYYERHGSTAAGADREDHNGGSAATAEPSPSTLAQLDRSPASQEYTPLA